VRRVGQPGAGLLKDNGNDKQWKACLYTSDIGRARSYRGHELPTYQIERDARRKIRTMGWYEAVKVHKDSGLKRHDISLHASAGVLHSGRNYPPGRAMGCIIFEMDLIRHLLRPRLQLDHALATASSAGGFKDING